MRAGRKTKTVADLLAHRGDEVQFVLPRRMWRPGCPRRSRCLRRLRLLRWLLRWLLRRLLRWLLRRLLRWLLRRLLRRLLRLVRRLR